MLVPNQLRSFVALAETRSFTRAAEVLDASQPTISRHLKLLEAELGQPLVEQYGRQVHLTEAGRTLELEARRVLGAFDGGSRGTAVRVLPATAARRWPRRAPRRRMQSAREQALPRLRIRSRRNCCRPAGQRSRPLPSRRRRLPMFGFPSSKSALSILA